MSETLGPDPLDPLRSANPVRADDLPAASLARVSASVQEHIVTEINNPCWCPLDEPLRTGTCGRANPEWADVRIVDPETDLELPMAPPRRRPSPASRPTTPPPVVARHRASSTTRRTCRWPTSCSTAPSPPSRTIR